MRVYVPGTLALLRGWVQAGAVAADAGHLTPLDDTEEAEYDTLLEAADASAALLPGAGRRVVVVAETSSTGAIPLRDVVAVHADTEDVDPADEDPPELGWFATQEIDDLLA
jgi:hypothetical protein